MGQVDPVVVVNHAEANAVEPAKAPEQILINPFIGEKIHYRFEVQTERLDGHQMTESLQCARWQSGMPSDRPRPRQSSAIRRAFVQTGSGKLQCPRAQAT